MGSVRQKPQSLSPAAISEKNRSFCSSVPTSRMVRITAWVGKTNRAEAGEALEISSITRQSVVASASLPPKATGKESFKSPARIKAS